MSPFGFEIEYIAEETSIDVSKKECVLFRSTGFHNSNFLFLNEDTATKNSQSLIREFELAIRNIVIQGQSIIIPDLFEETLIL